MVRQRVSPFLPLPLLLLPLRYCSSNFYPRLPCTTCIAFCRQVSRSLVQQLLLDMHAAIRYLQVGEVFCTLEHALHTKQILWQCTHAMVAPALAPAATPQTSGRSPSLLERSRRLPSLNTVLNIYSNSHRYGSTLFIITVRY